MADAPPRAATGHRAVTLAIGMMLLTYWLFSVVDTSTKYLLSVGLPALQLAFLRYAVHFVITIGDTARSGFRGLMLPRKALALALLRAAILVTSTVVNFIALKHLSLTVTSSIMFSAPLIVCLLSWPLLGERVGSWRLTAVFVGFAGVLFVIRPFGADFNWAALMMLIPATGMALYSILTRRLAGEVDPGSMQFLLGLVGTVVLSPFAWAYWRVPETSFETFLLFGPGLFAWAGHELLVRAHRRAPSNVLMPYSYSYLIYMAGFGYLLFGDVADGWTWVGVFIITLSGLAIWHRETSQARPAAQSG